MPHLKTNEEMREEFMKHFRITKIYERGSTDESIKYWLNIIKERDDTRIDLFIEEMSKRYKNMKDLPLTGDSFSGKVDHIGNVARGLGCNETLDFLITWAKGLKK